jgi:hypothetical protein
MNWDTDPPPLELLEVFGSGGGETGSGGSFKRLRLLLEYGSFKGTFRVKGIYDVVVVVVDVALGLFESYVVVVVFVIFNAVVIVPGLGTLSLNSPIKDLRNYFT